MALSNYYLEETTEFRTKVKQPDLSEIEANTGIDPATVAVETIDSFARFEELESGWNALFERAYGPNTIFQSFNWHWHWCRHYLKGKTSTLRIIAVWSREELVMVWPLVIERSMGVRQLKWMGEPVSQYGDILLDRRLKNGPIVGRVWDYIVKHVRVDLIALEKVRASSPVASLLNNRNAIITGCHEAPYLELGSSENYDQYELRYSGRARKNRRRHRRRLGEQAPLTFKLAHTGAQARQLVAQTIELKRKWLKDKGLVSRAFADQRFDPFFADVAGSEDHPCGCLVSVLMSGSKPVAYDVGFQSGHNYIAHIGAYDDQFERYSPGSLLMEEFLRRSYEIGIENYDLLAPRADYKMAWADDSVAMCDYAYPRNPQGYLYARGIIWLMRNAIKKTLGNTPEPLRRVTLPFFRIAGY